MWLKFGHYLKEIKPFSTELHDLHQYRYRRICEIRIFFTSQCSYIGSGAKYGKICYCSLKGSPGPDNTGTSNRRKLDVVIGLNGVCVGKWSWRRTIRRHIYVSQRASVPTRLGLWWSRDVWSEVRNSGAISLFGTFVLMNDFFFNLRQVLFCIHCQNALK